jgi:hypothetical protein
MKVAGSSIEAALGKSSGLDDILTGTTYIDERDNPDFDYFSQNNHYDSTLTGTEAQKFIYDRANDPQGPEDEKLRQYLTREAFERGIEIQYIKSKFAAHSTPKNVFNNKHFPVIAKNYFKFTILRNPWDLFVSYFWWSYYPMEAGPIGIDGAPVYPVKDINQVLMPLHLKPFLGDDKITLQRKLQGFMLTLADWSGVPYGLDERHQVVEWLADYTQSFLHSDVNYVMQFETLAADFKNVYARLRLPETELPYLKTGTRKAKMHYTDYYNTKTKELVGNAFSGLITALGYKFGF